MRTVGSNDTYPAFGMDLLFIVFIFEKGKLILPPRTLHSLPPYKLTALGSLGLFRHSYSYTQASVASVLAGLVSARSIELE